MRKIYKVQGVNWSKVILVAASDANNQQPTILGISIISMQATALVYLVSIWLVLILGN